MNFLSEVGKYSVDDHLDFFRRYKYFHMLNKVKSVQKYGFQIDFYEDEFLESNSYHFYKIIIYDIETKRVQYQNFIRPIYDEDDDYGVYEVWIPNEMSREYVVINQDERSFDSKTYYTVTYDNLEYKEKIGFAPDLYFGKTMGLTFDSKARFFRPLSERGVVNRWEKLSIMLKKNAYDTNQKYEKLSEIFTKEHIGWGSTLKSFFGLG